MTLQISIKNSAKTCEGTFILMWVNTYDSSGTEIDHRQIMHDGKHHHMMIASEKGNHVKMKLGLTADTAVPAWETESINNGDVIKFIGGTVDTGGETEINYSRGNDWVWGPAELPTR